MIAKHAFTLACWNLYWD